jgi:GDP-L-fucose synthase
MANSMFPYKFLMENIQIQTNLIDESIKHKCEKFIFLGSSCIYPKLAPQPLVEECLLTAPLEPTNEWYAIAKIAGLKACEAARKEYGLDYISLMPTNLYGPYDNFDLQTSHVLPAMIRKFHDAKLNNHSTVVLWGSGNPLREFLHVDDLARAVLFTMTQSLSEPWYNVGSGHDLSIKDLALMIQQVVGHQGQIQWDDSKPDGTPRKLMNVEKMAKEGWQFSIPLEDGIQSTYQWFLSHINDIKEVKI